METGKVNGNPLKFCLELDENGDVLINVKGHPMDIGEKLFLPFFKSMEMRGKAVAAGITTAMQLAYPKESKKIFINKAKKNGTSHRTAEV